MRCQITYVWLMYLWRWRSKWPVFILWLDICKQRSVVGQDFEQKQIKSRKKSKRYERISRNGTRKMRHVGDPERCSIESWTLIVCSCSTEMKNTSTREKKIVLHDWMFGWVHEICLGERLLSFHRAVALVTTLFYYYFYITFSVRQTSELSQPHRRRTKKKQKKKNVLTESFVCLSVGFQRVNAFYGLRVSHLPLSDHLMPPAHVSSVRARVHTHALHASRCQ